MTKYTVKNTIQNVKLLYAICSDMTGLSLESGAFFTLK